MEVFTISPKPDPQVLVLLPETIAFKNNAYRLKKGIVDNSDLLPKDFAFLGIPVPKTGRIKKDVLYELFTIVKNYIDTYGIKVVVIAHKDTWEAITNKAKFTENFGVAISGGYFSMGSGKKKKEVQFDKSVYFIPLINPLVVKKFPNRIKDLVKSLSIIPKVLDGTYTTGSKYEFNNVILTDVKEILFYLKQLFYKDKLFVDIETTGLNWYKDRLLSLSLTADTKNPVCIAIHPKYHSEDTYHEIKDILKRFFNKYEGTFIGHNWIAFDQAFIIHEIMRNGDFTINQEFLINSFKMEDTLLMAYLLYNSTERIPLGLKNLAFKYLGDWDKEIDQKNLFTTPLEEIGKYNNLDVIASKFVYDELWKKLNNEGLVDTYYKFKEVSYLLLKLKMNGLRIDYEKTKELYNSFNDFIKEEKEKVLANRYVKSAQTYLAYQKQQTAEIKKDLEEFIEEFNPNSSKQKQVLFFEVMDLPVLKTTKSGNNATDKETIKEWLDNPNIEEEKKEVLKLIQDYQMAEKIRNTYLKNMLENCIQVAPNDYRIFANFNQSGTISGRLSSSGVINFQTIPSGSKYGKLVKELFIAPEGFLLASSDYSALEDRLMANASQDPNKIAPFIDGIDGHSLNAFAYFRDELPDISERIDYQNQSEKFYEIKLKDTDKDTWYVGDKDPLLKDERIIEKKEISKRKAYVNTINLIKKYHKDIRQKGKPYTFGFSYGAGAEKFGEEIYNAYWQTYAKTKEYNEKIIAQVKKDGYLISRYSGLRLLIPDIHAQSSFDKAKAERVATNFNIQSGNILTLFAMVEFQKKVEENNLVDAVKIVNTVHDAIYLYVKIDPKIIKWVNDNLIECMIKDYNEEKYEKVSVPIDAELDIGYNMANVITLPNNIDEKEIETILKEGEING